MKKGTITLKQMRKLFNRAKKHKKKMGKLVGYVGDVPFYSNKRVPYGEIWIKSEEEFTKLVISDLDK